MCGKGERWRRGDCRRNPGQPRSEGAGPTAREPAYRLEERGQATWINPVTGERKDAGTFATGNLTGSTFPASSTQFFKTPSFWEDAVLLLEDVADNP